MQDGFSGTSDLSTVLYLNRNNGTFRILGRLRKNTLDLARNFPRRFRALDSGLVC